MLLVGNAPHADRSGRSSSPGRRLAAVRGDVDAVSNEPVEGAWLERRRRMACAAFVPAPRAYIDDRRRTLGHAAHARSIAFIVLLDAGDERCRSMPAVVGRSRRS